MEEATKIIVALIGLAGVLAGGYWQWVYKPKHRAEVESSPSMGDRALDQLLAEAERLQGVINSERASHDITRTQYVDVVRQLATVQAELKAAKRENANHAETIKHLRAEIADLRRKIENPRRSDA